jgi:hypothetical protein
LRGLLFLQRRDLPLGVGEGGLCSGPRSGHRRGAPVGSLLARQEARLVGAQLLGLGVGLLLQVGDLVGVLRHLVAQ